MSVYYYSDELAHYGVLGMKWGQRRAANQNYTGKQRKRDKAIYGNRAEKRINKKMNQGHGVQGARHYEVERKERKEKAKKIAKKGVRAAGKAVTTIGMMYLSDQVYNNGAGTRAVKKAAKTAGRAAVTAVLMAKGHTNIRWYD